MGQAVGNAPFRASFATCRARTFTATAVAPTRPIAAAAASTVPAVSAVIPARSAAMSRCRPALSSEVASGSCSVTRALCAAATSFADPTSRATRWDRSLISALAAPVRSVSIAISREIAANTPPSAPARAASMRALRLRMRLSRAILAMGTLIEATPSTELASAAIVGAFVASAARALACCRTPASSALAAFSSAAASDAMRNA